jgi:hypothetical protein
MLKNAGHRTISTFLIWTFSLPLYGDAILLAGHGTTSIPQPRYGHLVIHTRHSGLEVVVDGMFFGRTPLPPLSLPAGNHQILVSHPRRGSWMAQDWWQDIRIFEQDTLKLDVVFKMSYTIRSEPYGADVLVEGRKVGETPMYYQLNDDRIEQITITKKGFDDSTLVIGDAGKSSYDIDLAPSSKPSDIPGLAGVASETVQTTRRNPTILYAGATAALVTGALAFYLKKRANDNYDKYLKTGDSEQFSQYYDDANRYDNYFRLSFVGFQVSLVFTVLSFMK